MRKIMVALKRVLDYNVRVRIKSDGTGVTTEGARMSINPFDEIALEEALRIKEHGEAVEVLVVSIGAPDCQQQLRTGLAMGADRAILVKTNQTLEPLMVAKALKVLIDRESPELVMLGKQAIDSDNNQTGQMLAALWGRPQATFASELVIKGERAVVTREVDAGLEVIEVEFPAVFTTDLRLNEPRYVKLPEIMKAKKKPLDMISLAELDVEKIPQFRVVSTEPPSERQKGVIVKDTNELINLLRDRGLV